MSNTLSDLIDEIQFKSKKTLEEIADIIGYSRPHLNKQKLKGDNKKLEGILREKFKNILQNVPHGTPTPGYTISDQEYISKLERDKAFLEKIIDSSLLNIGASLTVIKEALLGDGAAEGEQNDAGSGDDANRAANTSKDKNVVVIRDKHPKKDKKSRV